MIDKDAALQLGISAQDTDVLEDIEYSGPRLRRR